MCTLRANFIIAPTLTRIPSLSPQLPANVQSSTEVFNLQVVRHDHPIVYRFLCSSRKGQTIRRKTDCFNERKLSNTSDVLPTILPWYNARQSTRSRAPATHFTCLIFHSSLVFLTATRRDQVWIWAHRLKPRWDEQFRFSQLFHY